MSRKLTTNVTNAWTSGWLGASLALLAACGGSSGPAKSTPCSRGELAECGEACDEDTACPSGLYCEGGKCAAECTQSSASSDCGHIDACTDEGQCLPLGPDGGLLTGDGSGDGSDGDGTGDGDSCPSVSVGATTSRPNVVLIIDQSSSMDEDFGDVSRWQAVKDALLPDDGLIAELQDRANFGVTLYSNREDGPTCPILTEVALPATLQDVRDVLEDADTIAETPTGDSIDAVLDGLDYNPLDSSDPTIFVLATDGEPDTCEQPNPQEGHAEALAAVARAYDAGIRTYMIAVADPSDISDEHVQDMANAGQGLENPAPGDEAPFYRVNETQGLVDAITGIITGVLSCELTLNGSVSTNPASICSVAGIDVQLNGNPLTCGDEHGWRLVDATHIEVLGDACSTLKSGTAALVATFPCDTVVVE